jgi:hypothetical protein
MGSRIAPAPGVSPMLLPRAQFVARAGQGAGAAMKRTIEILFSNRCPYVKLAIFRVLAILGKSRPDQDIEVKLIHVESIADAVRRHFPGSPTIRVDGRDVDRHARIAAGFCLRGRAYRVDGRLEPVPPQTWIARALGIDDEQNRPGTP